MTDNPFAPDYREPDTNLDDAVATAEQSFKAKSKSRAVYHRDVEQGSEQWHRLRCGILTASEMKLVITPTLKVADNDKVRTHFYHLAADLAPHCEGVAGLAHRSGDIGDELLAGRLDRLEFVIGIVQRRAGKVVHRGIDDDIGIARGRLDPDDLGHQHAGIAADEAARLEHQRDVPALGHARHHRAEFLGGRDGLAGMIGHAEPAAQIDRLRAVGAGCAA